jgi:hypothetical protein
MNFIQGGAATHFQQMETLMFVYHCDKCGREVERNNDAVLIDGEVNGFSLYHLMSDRHFLPVIENGEVVCPGSPSRAQYIEGQPKDSRGYSYDPRAEPLYRAAYAKLQLETN